MPIASSDIQLRLSGGANNINALASLGGAVSSNQVGADLFDDVSAAEAETGDVEFRCVYIVNNHTTLPLKGVSLYLLIDQAVANLSIALGLGSASVNGTEQSVANENTAPAGVTFSAAIGKANAIAVEDIPPLSRRSVWIRRTAGAGTTSAAPGTKFTIMVDGEATA